MNQCLKRDRQPPARESSPCILQHPCFSLESICYQLAGVSSVWGEHARGARGRRGRRGCFLEGINKSRPKCLEGQRFRDVVAIAGTDPGFFPLLLEKRECVIPTPGMRETVRERAERSRDH